VDILRIPSWHWLAAFVICAVEGKSMRVVWGVEIPSALFFVLLDIAISIVAKCGVVV